MDIRREPQYLQHVLCQFLRTIPRFALQSPACLCHLTPDSCGIQTGRHLELFRKYLDALLSYSAHGNVSDPGKGYAVPRIYCKAQHRKDILDFQPFIEGKSPDDPVWDPFFQKRLFDAAAERVHSVKYRHLTVPVPVVPQALYVIGDPDCLILICAGPVNAYKLAPWRSRPEILGMSVGVLLYDSVRTLKYLTGRAIVLVKDHYLCTFKVVCEVHYHTHVCSAPSIYRLVGIADYHYFSS
ncbi:hypothetical protein SDC9_165846 [bioreactor metagenome]|uniref:Uncharacterized protein n=1 Tax=bioreactor metagenome TaxID=1076179 RepID=A0A645FX85_9ZZZZ